MRNGNTYIVLSGLEICLLLLLEKVEAEALHERNEHVGSILQCS